MPQKDPVKEEFKNDLPAHSGKSNLMLNKPFTLGLLAFFIFIFLFGSLIYQRFIILKQEQKKEAFVAAENAKEKLQEVLAYSISATKTLAFFIDKKGVVNNFDSVAAEIVNANKNIDALELVPGGVIQNIYPLKGNENVLGYDILKDPARSKEAFKAIQKKELVFSGPFNLKQGGFGIVGRLPVFRNGEFWGFSAVVIKMSTLLKATGIDRTGNDGYYYQLSKINPDTKKEEFFIPHVNEPLTNFLYAVDIPVGDWKLSVEPVIENKGIGGIYILALMGLLCSVLGAFFVYNILRRPEKLDRLVKERTKELKGSENKYRSVIERVSDAFVSLDTNWNYTFVNNKAGEIFGKKPEKLVGKNIWKEFPEGIDHPFYHAYYRAMKTQQFQYLEEYYPLHEKWFENHIYPSKDGLTIFFKDITEVKKISLALNENEEKYHSLIEQASDGIVITDLDGYILEVNKSMALMSGYNIEEMQGKNIKEFLPANDVEINPLRIKELLGGKSLLYERKLLKKDGSVLDIEVNSKMASSQTLIGFIRDVSERKKTEEAIHYQARLLQSVSDAITSLDMNRSIVSWNTACEELYGFTAEEAIGKRVPELVTFEYPDTTNDEVFKQVFNTGYWKGEFNFIHPKTNEKIFLLSNINVLKNNEGIVNGFIITSKNITDRKKAEEEIKISNERFEQIARSTNDAVWDHDFLLNETWGNNELYILYGLEAGKQKIDFEMFLERIHPDERDDILRKMNDVISKQGSSISEEFRFRTASGEYKNFYDRAYIKYDENGKPLRILGAMQDITEREKAKQAIFESEEKFSKAFHSNLLGLALYDADFRIIDLNDAYATILESAPKKLIGKTSGEAGLISKVNIEKRMTLDKKIDEILDTEGKLNNFEMEIETVKGKSATVLVSMEPLVLNDKKFWLTSAIDITAKKEADKALQHSEERYRSLVENATEALAVLDGEKQIFLMVSESATKLFKMSREELLKVGPGSVSPEYQPDGRLSSEVATEIMQKAIQGEKPVFEWTLCDKEGNLIPCEIWLVRLPSEKGILIRGTIINITERKKTEQQLKENEERLRFSLEAANQGLYDVNVQTGEAIVNDQYAMMLGYDPATFKETNSLWLERLHPDDHASTAKAYKEYIQGITEDYKIEFRQRTKDNNWKWILSLGKIVEYDKEGQPLRMLGTHTDITERKKAEKELLQSEQKYRLLFYNNPLPMWMTTMPGLAIIDVNEAAIKRYGYTRDEFLKMSTKDLRPAEDVENFLKEIDKMKPGIINTRAWRHLKKDGTIIQVETHSHQIMYEGKMGWLALSNDVTEKYNAKELLQRSYEEIRQLASNLQSIREDERTSIAREIHDELGQQLTGLKMDLHWLTRKLNSADEQVNSKMRESIELINATIASVRKIATNLRPSILDDLGLIAALEWQSEEFEKRSGIKVKFNNKAGDLSVKPEVTTTLFRIYQELLTNIARHANANMVTAILFTDDDNLYFSISDNGIGFNLETISNKKTLGLLGIKERTLLIGGKYEIRTNPGKGSETIISIPLNFVTITN